MTVGCLTFAKLTIGLATSLWFWAKWCFPSPKNLRPDCSSMLYGATWDSLITQGNYNFSITGKRKWLWMKIWLIIKIFRALLALRQCLPDQLRDNTFASCLQEDSSTEHWLNQLLKNLEAGPQPGQLNQAGQQDPHSIRMSPLTS